MTAGEQLDDLDHDLSEVCLILVAIPQASAWSVTNGKKNIWSTHGSLKTSILQTQSKSSVEGTKRFGQKIYYL